MGNQRAMREKETIVVSATISISVGKVHHEIRLRNLSCSKMSENHREPEVPEERAPVITLEELAITHFVENGTLQNACATRPRVVVGLGRSAHSNIVRLMNSRQKGPKRMMTNWQDSGITEWNQLYKRFKRFSRCWISTQWTIPRNQSTSVFPTSSRSWWNAEPFSGNAEPQKWAAKHLGHTWYIGKRFCKSSSVFFSTLSAGVETIGLWCISAHITTCDEWKPNTSWGS